MAARGSGTTHSLATGPACEAPCADSAASQTSAPPVGKVG